MPQRSKQTTQTIFSTGFSLSFLRSQTASPMGKVPPPVAIAHKRRSHGPEPHGAGHRPSGAGRWLHPNELTEQRAAPSLPFPVSYRLCFNSNGVPDTALQPAALFPSAFQPGASRRFAKCEKSWQSRGVAISPVSACKQGEEATRARLHSEAEAEPGILESWQPSPDLVTTKRSLAGGS